MSFHFFSTTCLPLRSPKSFCPRVYLWSVWTQGGAQRHSVLSVLILVHLFRGSAVQGTLCRTWLSRDPTGLCPEAFPVWKENRPILADPERPYKPLMNVCWTALGWIQCQPQLYVQTPPQSLYLICSVWAPETILNGNLQEKIFPLCKSFVFNMFSSFLFTNPWK